MELLMNVTQRKLFALPRPIDAQQSIPTDATHLHKERCATVFSLQNEFERFCLFLP
jgi:hypothetical protein